MIRKYTGLLLLLLLAFTFAACSTADSDTDNSPTDTGDTDLSGLESDLEVESEEETDITILAVYYPDENGETILSEITTYDQNAKLSETEVLEVLAEYEVISSDITFHSSQEATTENNTYILTLDLSAGLTAWLNSLEPETEPLIVQCIANTFIDYYHMDELILTVDGESLITDHYDYTTALAYADVDAALITQKTTDDQE